MKCSVEMGLGGMIYIPSFMKIYVAVEGILMSKAVIIILMAVGFKKRVVEMGSIGVIYLPVSMTIGLDI
jgi:hypothetical protein